MSETFSFGYVTLAFVLAVIGGSLGASLGTSHRRLCALISLGAGTLLGVTVFGILPESSESLNWWELLLSLASGYVLFALITKYVYHVCPACAASHFDEATTHRFSEIATAMMIALAIHCTVDGLAMAAGHEAHEASHTEAARAVGMTIVLAVCIHKVPEGLALGALLLGAGLNKTGVILRVAAVESTTIVGGFVGLVFLKDVSGPWIGAALAHAGGGFFFLAVHAVLGEIWKHHKGLVLANFGAGFAIIGVATWILRTH
jgi:zinc transporter ZupT